MRVSKKFLIFVVLAMPFFNAQAESKVGVITSNIGPAFDKQSAGGILEPAVQQKIEDERTKATLRNDLRLLDIEIEKCEKQKRGWTAATVIGAVGVVSTGVAAGVQGSKLKEQKQEINSKQQELSSLRSENQ